MAGDRENTGNTPPEGGKAALPSDMPGDLAPGDLSADDLSEATSQELGRLKWKVAAARLALAWERLWPALWPSVGLGGIFLTLALFDVLPWLPMWLHGFVLAAFATAMIAAFWHGVRRLRFPDKTAGRRRLESSSGLAHRPLALLRDKLALGSDDPEARALWRAHRIRTLEKIRALRIGIPEPGLARRDPLALRGALLVILLIGITIAWGDGVNRIARALAPGVGGPMKGPAMVDIWITPPAYTGMAPIFLSIGKEGGGKEGGGKSQKAPLLVSATDAKAVTGTIKGPIAIPEGSLVLAQLSGGWGKPRLVIGNDESEFKPVADGTYKLSTKIALQAGIKNIAVRQGGREIGSWAIHLIADQPPIIDFGDDPSRSARSALRVSMEGSDDYGLAEARLYLRRGRIGGEEIKQKFGQKLSKDKADKGGKPKQDGDEAARAKLNAPHVLKLPLPGGGLKDIKETSYHDLTAHPWAGLEVEMQIVARDAAGQPGASDTMTVTLPERHFRHPVARALVLLRKRLAQDPDSRDQVIDDLVNLSTIPESFENDTAVFLAIRAMARNLTYDPGLGALADVQKLMWDTALHLEDGKLSSAERRLREIQKKLMEALKKKAGNAEIQKLMRELQQAMSEFLREMMKGMKNLPNMAQPFNPNSRSLSPRDLQRMLDRARKLAMTGDLEAARKMLSMLREMLENLRSGKFAMGRGGRPGQSKAWKMLQDLQDMMRRQQELMDKTFKESQQGRGSGKKGADKEGARKQGKLRDQLQDLLRRFGEMMGKVPKSLGDGELSMREALEALRKGRPGDAVGPQGKALESLRRGLGEMAQQFMRRFGRGQARGRGRGRGRGRMGRRPGQMPYAYDPLGRRIPNTGLSSADDVDIPDEMDTQRARDILKELRRRAGEIGRPEIEMDYLERLLKRF